jgi:predicted DNA-binding transcriptional regulator AlpA
MKTPPENSGSFAPDRESIDDSKNPNRMLGVREAAVYLNVSQSWLNKRRIYGDGPRYAKFGRRVNYLVSDLDDFAASNRRQNTSQQSND